MLINCKVTNILILSKIRSYVLKHISILRQVLYGIIGWQLCSSGTVGMPNDIVALSLPLAAEERWDFAAGAGGSDATADAAN